MHILKPLQLTVLHRTFSVRGRHMLSAAGLMAVPLGGGDPVLEQDFWRTVSQELGKDAMLDAAMPKDRAEVLLTGRFHAPGGAPVRAGKVRLRFGSVDKTLAVFGDRYWQRGLPTEPTAIAELPLTYAQAFGGEEFERNPLGKGFRPLADADGVERQWLPNIEDPQRLIGSPSDRPEPAGFAALDLGWPQRMSKAGTYDEAWLRERAPGLADDIDWSYFNDTAPDQWLEGFPKGDEAFELHNLHPEKPLLNGRLPGLRGRCFVNVEVDGALEFRELPMRLDTVHFLPGAELAVLIFRGVTEVATPFGHDAKHLLLAYERLGAAPRPLEHYRAAMAKRIDPEQAYRYLLTSIDLIPADARCGYARLMEDSGFPLEQHMLVNQQAGIETHKSQAQALIDEEKRKLAEMLKAQGLDPAEYLAAFDKTAEIPPEVQRLQELMARIAPGFDDPSKPMDLTQVDFAAMDELPVLMTQIAAEKKAGLRAQLEAELAKARTAGLPAEAIAALEEALAKFDRPPPLPRSPAAAALATLREQVDVYERQCASLRAQGVPESQLPTLSVDIDALEQKLLEADCMARDAYRLGAHFIEAGLPPHAGREDALARTLLDAFARGEAVADGDYAAIDLSGRDLRGIDLSGCYLEDVRLTGADLSNAILTNAILARADLRDARLTGADLRGANLGRAQLQGADFTRADLSGGVLSHSVLAGACFRDCQLTEVSCLETHFAGADFGEAKLYQVNFIDGDFSGCRFQGADLRETNWIKPRFAAVDFSGAEADSMTVVEGAGAGAVFRGARLANARFVGNCDLAGADFSDATLERANLRENRLQGARFSGARLEMADLGGAQLQGADFGGAYALRAQFNQADLSGARFVEANLSESALLQARLVEADFSNSNLYAVNFIQATLGQTRFEGANLERSLLEDWQP